MTLSVTLLYRTNNKYKNIYDFINSLKNIKFNKLIIYNLSNDLINKIDYKLINFDHSYLKENLFYTNIIDKPVQVIREMIYNNLTTDELILYDSCLDCSNVNIIRNTNNYILLKNKITIPYLFYYNCKNDKLSRDEFISIHSYKTNSIIVESDVFIDNNFYYNLFIQPVSENNILDKVIINYLNTGALDEDEKNMYLTKANSIQKDYIQYLVLNNTKIKENIDELCNLFNKYDKFYKLWILFNNYTNEEIIRSNILNDLNTKITNSVIYIDTFLINNIIVRLFSLLEVKNNGTLDTVPDWFLEYDIDIIDKYYTNIVSKSILIDDDKVILDNDIILVNKHTFSFNNNNLTILNDTITINNSVIGTFTNFALLDNTKSNSDKDILLLVSLNPVKFKFLNKTGYLETNMVSDLKYVELLGNFIKINNHSICLVRCSKKTFRFIILNEDINTVKYSNKFYIEHESVIGLYKMNEIFLITVSNNMYYKHKLDIVSIYTDLMHVLDLKNNLNLKISNKTNIELNIDNYNNIIQEYKNFKFNQNDDTLAKINFLYTKRLIKYNDIYYYHNKFVYLPSKTNDIVKLYDVFIHESVLNESVLIDMLNNLEITKGSSYKNCRYIIISQVALEEMNSLEISKIIDYNTLIISLIDNDKVENNTYTKTYTSDGYLNKLYLINIAKNDSYVTYIIDKILEINQYSNRLPYMEIDKERIFENTNIYQIILSIISKKKKYLTNIKLTDKEKIVVNNIQQKFFSNYNNKLVRFIVNSNYNCNIGYIENDIIPINIKTINFLGNIMKYSKISEEIYHIICISSKKILDTVHFESNNILVYDVSNNDLIMT